MFQSLQATFVIITDLPQKVKGFLAFCSTFFQIFFPSRYPTRGLFPLRFSPLVLSPGPRSGFLHLHRYSYYVASYALFLHPWKQINCCLKYPQRSKLPTFHTLSKVLKLHMSFNTVPILWLEGRAGMVRASWYKDDGEYLRTFGYQKKARHCSKYAATFACWIKSVRTGPIFTVKKQKNKTAKFFQT